MPSTIGKSKLFRIKHITLLEGKTLLRNKHEIAFFEIKCTFFGRKENTISYCKQHKLPSYIKTFWVRITSKMSSFTRELSVGRLQHYGYQIPKYNFDKNSTRMSNWWMWNFITIEQLCPFLIFFFFDAKEFSLILFSNKTSFFDRFKFFS